MLLPQEPNIGLPATGTTGQQKEIGKPAESERSVQAELIALRAQCDLLQNENAQLREDLRDREDELGQERTRREQLEAEMAEQEGAALEMHNALRDYLNWSETQASPPDAPPDVGRSYRSRFAASTPSQCLALSAYPSSASTRASRSYASPVGLFSHRYDQLRASLESSAAAAASARDNADGDAGPSLEEDPRLAELGPKLGHLGYTIAALARQRTMRAGGGRAPAPAPPGLQPIDDTTPPAYAHASTPFRDTAAGQPSGARHNWSELTTPPSAGGSGRPPLDRSADGGARPGRPPFASLAVPTRSQLRGAVASTNELYEPASFDHGQRAQAPPAATPLSPSCSSTSRSPSKLPLSPSKLPSPKRPGKAFATRLSPKRLSPRPWNSGRKLSPRLRTAPARSARAAAAPAESARSLSGSPNDQPPAADVGALDALMEFAKNAASRRDASNARASAARASASSLRSAASPPVQSPGSRPSPVRPRSSVDRGTSSAGARAAKAAPSRRSGDASALFAAGRVSSVASCARSAPDGSSASSGMASPAPDSFPGAELALDGAAAAGAPPLLQDVSPTVLGAQRAGGGGSLAQDVVERGGLRRVSTQPPKSEERRRIAANLALEAAASLHARSRPKGARPSFEATAADCQGPIPLGVVSGALSSTSAAADAPPPAPADPEATPPRPRPTLANLQQHDSVSKRIAAFEIASTQSPGGCSPAPCFDSPPPRATEHGPMTVAPASFARTPSYSHAPSTSPYAKPAGVGGDAAAGFSPRGARSTPGAGVAGAVPTLVGGCADMPMPVMALHNHLHVISNLSTVASLLEGAHDKDECVLLTSRRDSTDSGSRVTSVLDVYEGV